MYIYMIGHILSRRGNATVVGGYFIYATIVVNKSSRTEKRFWADKSSIISRVFFLVVNSPPREINNYEKNWTIYRLDVSFFFLNNLQPDEKSAFAAIANNFEKKNIELMFQAFAYIPPVANNYFNVLRE